MDKEFDTGVYQEFNTGFLSLEEVSQIMPSSIRANLAYTIGILFFRPQLCLDEDGKTMIRSGVYHRKGFVKEEQVAAHKILVQELLDEVYSYDYYDDDNRICTYYDPVYRIKISDWAPLRMIGFSLYLPYTNQTQDSDELYVQKLLGEIVKGFKLTEPSFGNYNYSQNSSPNPKYLLGGLFDGRSSYDNGSLVAVDFSGDYRDRKEEFDVIEALIGPSQVNINLSDREERLPQFRVKVDTLIELVESDKVVMLSPKRRERLGL